MFSHVLVPLDGSSVASQAVPYAVALAHAYNSRISLLGVVEPYPTVTRIPDATTREMDERRVTTTTSYLESVAIATRAHDLSVTTTVRHGNVADQILQYAEDEACSLIVMGSHARTGLDRVRLGSVAQHVVRDAPIPTLVVPPRAHGPAEGAAKIAAVTATLDGSPLAEAALPIAVEVAERLTLPLTLLTILPNLAFSASYAGDFAYYPVTEDAEREQERWAEQYLGQMAARLRAAGLEVCTMWRRSVTNRAEEMIAAYLAERPDGIAVMASHGRGGVLRWALGSTAERVLDQGASPILLVRSGTGGAE